MDGLDPLVLTIEIRMWQMAFSLNEKQMDEDAKFSSTIGWIEWLKTSYSYLCWIE
jgi:hypothetical protein